MLRLVDHPANTEIDTTPPAPGELELVRAFLSLHDHEPGNSDSLPPSTSTIRWWLTEQELLPADAEASPEDLAWAAEVLEALRSRVFENMGEPPNPAAMTTLDDATARAGLVPRFGAEGLVPTAQGVRGAIGQVLAVAFLADLDGSWKRFRECGSPDCRSVFYDRSKNHSGRWCTMAECGNRAKVRAYRERARTKT
jgi:predicted RNA-binding Zn ribbon-like protein